MFVQHSVLLLLTVLAAEVQHTESLVVVLVALGC
jgi:hypothetical protein